MLSRENPALGKRVSRTAAAETEHVSFPAGFRLEYLTDQVQRIGRMLLILTGSPIDNHD
jgi:hypothetical protein